MSTHRFIPVGSDSFKCSRCGLVCDNTDFPELAENVCQTKHPDAIDPRTLRRGDAVRLYCAKSRRAIPPEALPVLEYSGAVRGWIAFVHIESRTAVALRIDDAGAMRDDEDRIVEALRIPE